LKSVETLLIGARANGREKHQQSRDGGIPALSLTFGSSIAKHGDLEVRGVSRRVRSRTPEVYQKLNESSRCLTIMDAHALPLVLPHFAVQNAFHTFLIVEIYRVTRGSKDDVQPARVASHLLMVQDGSRLSWPAAIIGMQHCRFT
jgi:hypothetical protein